MATLSDASLNLYAYEVMEGGVIEWGTLSRVELVQIGDNYPCTSSQFCVDWFDEHDPDWRNVFSAAVCSSGVREPGGYMVVPNLLQPLCTQVVVKTCPV